MATQGGDYHHGDMNINEQEQTFSGFVKMTKWGSLYLAGILMFLVLWFCTTTGFLGALVTGAAILVVGTLVLSEKHKL